MNDRLDMSNMTIEEKLMVWANKIRTEDLSILPYRNLYLRAYVMQGILTQMYNDVIANGEVTIRFEIGDE